MWMNNRQENYPMDELFNDLIQECKYVAPGAHLTHTLRNRIENYNNDERKEIVSRVVDGCAPLFVACERGHLAIVEYLITVCHADIEQRGRYEVSDDRSVHYATPLWCAAVCGKLTVVKCLIAHGANVNAVSDTGSTPIRSACFMTHIEIISYLLEKGADVTLANYAGGTCLINAVQSVKLCTLLIEHGADVNATDSKDKTALHYAIQDYKLDTIKLLLKHNADPYLRSRHDDDALQEACLKGAREIFEYLVKKVPYSPERLADANELMGSTFFEDHNKTQIALKYWRAGLTIRHANMINGMPLPKRPVLPKRETYRNATEFTTYEELNVISLDLDAIRIQSLLICERVLGPHHKDTQFRLMFRGASYADSLRYQPCIDFWRRALEVKVEKDSILYTDTCITAQAVVRLMVNLNKKMMEVIDRNRDKEEPRFCDVVAIFKLLSSQLTGGRELLEKYPVHKKQQESYERILKCVTHMIYLLVETAQTNGEKIITRQLVHDLVKQNPRSTCTDDTLLHLCVSSSNTISSSYFSIAEELVTIFPHLEVVKVLLECGANVNARNESRSTPLHIASNVYNFQNPLIKLLLEYGAHLDIPNKAGDTPAQLISTNPENNVNLVNYMSLQCHAARVICEYGIYCIELPITLHHFLESHRE